MKELKITGVKEIAGNSKKLENVSIVLEVFYDRESGRAWCFEHVNRNSWTVYEDRPNYIACGYIEEPVTMKEVREMIEDNVAMYDRYQRFLERLSK